MGSTLFKVGNSRRLAGITPSSLGLSLLQSTNNLSVSSGTVTSNTPILNLSQTWNNAGVAFTGLKFDVTDSNSASGSLLADFQIGGSSKFSVRKDGVLTTGKVAASGSYVYGAPQFYSSTYGTNVGMQIKANNEIAFYCSGTAVASVNYNSGITLGSTNSIGWVNGHAIANPPDLFLYRDAANTLALRNGVNSQAFSIYNTWGNSGTDYERLKIFWAGNTCFIDTQADGTGSNRVLDIGGGGSDLKLTTGNNLILQTSGHVARLYLASTGHLLWISDNTLNIGQSGANRPRTGYFGTSLNVASGAITANTPMLDLSQTWNNGAVTFNALTVSVTDNASAGGSLFQFNRNGTLLSDLSPSGLLYAYGGFNANQYIYIGNGNVKLYGPSANVFEQRNGVNAQTLRTYNTYTSSTSYERLAQTWLTNVCNIWTEKGSGGGTARDLVLGADATELVRFQTGSKIGFFGVTPVTRPSAYTVTNGATDRDYDASATTVGELANVLSTLLADLKNLGLIS